MPLAQTPAAAETGLNALLNADFDWVKRLNEVWSDSATDVPELHADLRADVQQKLKRLSACPAGQRSQLILPYLGKAGSGKTHLLSFVRREAIARGMQFVLVDLTDVQDFWSTVTLGYLDSLSRRVNGGSTQLESALRKLIAISLRDPHPEQTVERLAGLPPAELNEAIGRVLNELYYAHVHLNDLIEYHNVIHALFFLNSRDLATCDLAHTWLQGRDLETSDARQLGIRVPVGKLFSIVKGLSWVMSLCAPTVLAFDQLDAIVTQHDLAAASPSRVEATEEQRSALAIIVGIASGLAAMVDVTVRTLPIMTALSTTWDALKKRGLAPNIDRFEQTHTLMEITSENVAKSIVERRLAEAYRSAGFSPPYPTWPFRPECFRVQGAFPRQILQRCAEHQTRCANENKIIEISELPTADQPTGTKPEGPNEWARFDQELANASARPLLLEESQEDELGKLILHGCELLIKETTVPPDVDLLLDSDFAGYKTFPALHARLRTVYHGEGDREEHACLRVLQRTNPAAYKARLCAAMTASGIDRDLPFRKLVIIRTTPRLTGPKMTELTGQFERRGGLLVGISEVDLGKIKVLIDLSRLQNPEFDDWLRERQPLSRLAFFGQLLTQPRNEGNEQARPTEKPQITARPSATRAALPQPQVAGELALLIGRRLIAGKPDTLITLPAKVLTQHTVIRAGSGGGKTVLLKRLVEEAALSGIPSILIDVANDLAQIGDRWPAEPENWIPGDSERARQYHRDTEVVIWTPGRAAGRPLQLATLPDFTAMDKDEDQLNAAVDMAMGTLEQYAAPGAGEAARKKKGVLAGALRYYARRGGGDMEALIAFLSDMPMEAGSGIAGSQRIAASIADNLRAMVQTEPLLQNNADIVDPGLLLGVGNKRTRISVISLIGLGTLDAQQNFVNQLAMALFSWIKKHPSLGPHGITGLFVIDEAKDFLPAVSTTPCKDNLMRLAAQARKYGLGLVFATQNPKDLDYRAVAQFTTQFFGKANSPQVIQFIQGLLAEKGGSGDDVGRLQRGQFYVTSEGLQVPIRISVPMCLSHHPEGRPLTEAEILTKARSG